MSKSDTIIRSTQFIDGYNHATPSIAAHVDVNIRFTETTEFTSHVHGFKSADHTSGKSLYDIQCDVVRNASELERQFRKTMHTERPVDIIDLHRFADGHIRLLVTSKFPTYNDSQILDGAGCTCYEITGKQRKRIINNLLLSTTQKYLDNKNFISLSYELVDHYEELQLTNKESECLYFLIRGYSAKSISHILNRSPRTIETHINNIKQRLGCSSRLELIDLVFAHNVLQQIPRSLCLSNLHL